MTAEEVGRRGTAPGPAALARSAGFALLFLVAVLLGRMTIMDGTSLSLVWPAAGVAVVWFATQRRVGTLWLDLALLGVVTLVVNTATGASIGLALCFVVANTVQLMIFHVLFARWCPELWGAGGRLPMTGVRQLGRLLGAALLSTAGGAAIGPSAVWALTGSWTAAGTAVWMARNSVSIVLVAAVGLRIGCLLADRRDRRAAEAAGLPFEPTMPIMRPGGRRLAELVLVLGVSVAVYTLVFHTLDLPIGFVTIALIVWFALRFDTTLVVLHDLVFGTAAVLLTLDGTGPFAGVPDLGVRALVVQCFTGVVATVGLALALSRDEREVLLRRLRAEAERAAAHAGRMQVLAGVSRSLASATDARSAICAAAREIAGADGAYLVEPDGEGRLVSTGMAGITLSSITLDAAVRGSMSARVLASAEPAFAADVATQTGISAAVRDALGVRSAAWQPVLAEGGRAVGVIGIIWRTRIEELPPSTAPMLETLAAEAASAIMRADLLNRLSQYADRDPLTGVENRHRWEATVSREITAAQRSGRPVSFALADLDHLKAYNEEHGQPAGDDLLKRFAAAITACLREGVDTVARAEGGGFWLALPGRSAEEALAVADALRAAVPEGRTCTVGIAPWAAGMSGAQVLGNADRALYRGKQSGRDVAVVHRSDVQLAPAP